MFGLSMYTLGIYGALNQSNITHQLDLQIQIIHAPKTLHHNINWRTNDIQFISKSEVSQFEHAQ